MRLCSAAPQTSAAETWMILRDGFQSGKVETDFCLSVLVFQRGPVGPRGSLGPPGVAGVPGVDAIDVSQRGSFHDVGLSLFRS